MRRPVLLQHILASRERLLLQHRTMKMKPADPLDGLSDDLRRLVTPRSHDDSNRSEQPMYTPVPTPDSDLVALRRIMKPRSPPAVEVDLDWHRIDSTDYVSTATDIKAASSSDSGTPSTTRDEGSGGPSVTEANATPSGGAEADEDDITLMMRKKSMTPTEIVEELSKYIIGQEDAKRAVAVSLRNRWRRSMVNNRALRDDISPKNILMIGPTGVGKTEISRRMAKIIEAPFVKVEATKFTEVGFRGRDVDTIIEDLYSVAVQRARKMARERHRPKAKEAAVKVVLSKLVPADKPDEVAKYQQLLANGDLDDKEIEFTVVLQEEKTFPPKNDDRFPMMMQYTNEEKRTQRLKKPIKEALPLIEDDELNKLLDEKQISVDALKLAENHGVVFIDEIDKMVVPEHKNYHTASSEGVQQDLLPLIEGCIVTLKDGNNMRTDNVLFICSGAFHVCKPKDMIAELQGRLPVRVELIALTESDFYRVLTEPKYNIIKQNIELFKTEGIDLHFTEGALKDIARFTREINCELQNIGARRLITVVEKVMEDLSYTADDYHGKKVTVDSDYVREKIRELRKPNTELQRCIL